MRDEKARKQDIEFFTRFGLVLLGLVVFAIACVIIARMVSPTSTDLKEAVNSPEAIAERIAPAGRLLVEGAELPEGLFVAQDAPAPVSNTSAAADAPASAGAERSGEEIYVQACQLCHGIGLAGAPKPGDAAVWESRVAQGLDTIYLNAINGIRGMPARGGQPNLSDQEVRSAVDHMLP